MFQLCLGTFLPIFLGPKYKFSLAVFEIYIQMASLPLSKPLAMAYDPLRFSVPMIDSTFDTVGRIVCLPLENNDLLSMTLDRV